jgi:hypothetical protein
MTRNLYIAFTMLCETLFYTHYLLQLIQSSQEPSRDIIVMSVLKMRRQVSYKDGK